MYVQHRGDVGDRLRWGLIPLAVLIGLTAYVGSDDMLVSFLLSAALGLSSLVAAWLLLRGVSGGSALAALAAAALIVVQFADLNAISFGWIRATYVVIGALTLAFAAAAMIASQWGVLHRSTHERITL